MIEDRLLKTLEDRILNTLSSDSNRVIFKSILSEAESAVRKYMNKGYDVIKAVNAVSEHMTLTKFEAKVLVERLKKPDPNEKSEIIAGNSPVIENTNRQHVIYFEEVGQLDEAVQILMDKSIAWSEKASNEQRPFVEFSDDAKLIEAQSALRRKWDFVESRKRLVADVQFDNLKDYTRVLEFMRRQGMLLEFKDDLELDEDYDQVRDKSASEQKIAEKENRPYSVAEGVSNFVAKPRIIRQKERVDPTNETRFRAVHARRKFS